MKRFFCIVVVVLFVCACSKGGGDPAVTVVPESTAVSVSGPAGDEEKEGISQDRAFAAAEELLADMSLEEKIGQMFMVHLSQLDGSHTEDGNQYKATDKMCELLDQYNIGGVYLTSNNIAGEKQTKKLTKSLQASVSGGALYIAAEEEGGERPAKDLAEELSEMGINLNLAPIADVASEENEEYARRCLGSDTDTVISRTESFIGDMQGSGVGTTLKYFPGIANVRGNPAVELLENQDSLMTLRNRNFATYQAGIRAGADAVMMSSVSVSKVTINKVPAFLSEEIVTNLLREELGFGGVIMTPFLDEPLIREKYTPGFVAVEAVKAGCDMLMMSYDWKESYETLLAAVRRGDINEKVINTAVQRILQNKIQRGILIMEE